MNAFSSNRATASSSPNASFNCGPARRFICMTTQTSPSAPAAGPALRFAPADLWRMFKERWLAGLLVGVVAAAAIVYFEPVSSPLYRTEVYLLFSAKKDRVLNIPEVVDTRLDSPVDLQTHVEQLRSKSFFEYLLVSFTPEETKRIQAPYLDTVKPGEAPPTLAAIIRPNVSVFIRKGTTILGIAVSNRDPENAALIANRYARKYIDFNLDRATTGTNSAIVFLRNQSEDLRRQVASSETALQAYRAQHNLAALGESQNVVLQKLSSLGTTLVRAQMEQIELQTVIDNVKRLQAAGRPLTELTAILAASGVAQAKANLESLQAKRVLLAEHYLRRHPKMIENEIEAGEAARQLDTAITHAVADFNTRLDVATRYEKQLNEEMRATEAKARELDKVSIDYRFLEQDVLTKRASYARINDRLNDASITSQLDDVNIRIFDQAWIAAAPPDNRFNLTLLIASGVCLGCLLVVPLALGFFDTRVKTTGQVETILGQKLLGVLHRIPKSTAPERAQAFLREKDGPLTESYRGLYGEIGIASTLNYPKSLLVTSSVPGEGKSLVAGNLGAVFSSHGPRTLLVDCDLRRPSLHDYFQVSGKEGWIQWLQLPAAERPPLPAAIINLAPHLDLLPAGTVPSNCTQMIEQLANAGVQKQLLAAYDLVIFDTPPATIFPDALLLARSCHEMVFVCQFSSVPLAKVRRAIAHLCSTGVQSLGVILNQMPPTNDAPGFYGYGTKPGKYYKAYGQRDRKPA
jgi:capsular exopolysaccharide synthesis family protein